MLPDYFIGYFLHFEANFTNFNAVTSKYGMKVVNGSRTNDWPLKKC
jgi:hypothetical protein